MNTVQCPTMAAASGQKDGPENGSESPSKRIKIDIGGSPFMKKLELENDDKMKIVQYRNDWKVSGNSYMVHVLDMSAPGQRRQVTSARGCTCSMTVHGTAIEQL